MKPPLAFSTKTKTAVKTAAGNQNIYQQILLPRNNISAIS